MTTLSPPLAMPAAPRRVCVFCGASAAPDPVYAAAAATLGASLARAGVGVVYGGGAEGLMGIVAQAACEAGGEVIGIMPGFMAERVPRLLLDRQFTIVGDMHARKQAMYEAADAFVALPGGIGTLEELAEQLTWLKLGRHRKPVVIANVADFWAPLLRLFDHMTAERFLHAGSPRPYAVCDSIDGVLAALGIVLPVGLPSFGGAIPPLDDIYAVFDAPDSQDVLSRRWRSAETV